MAIPVDGSWTLTFDEEFNGTALNKAVWGDNWLGNPGAITKPVNSEELGAYDPAQVSVSGGYLNLTAVANPATVNGKTYAYRSGLVNTHDSFSQAFGYFEARVNVPGKDGKIVDWPSFWTDGENWPYDGEMDVMEGLGGEAAYHFHSPSGGPGKSVKGDFTGWHTFGALWEPGSVKFYYDNTFVGEITSGITSSPQYIILNLGIGINSILQVPATMQVDWVHVYSIDPNAVAVAPQENYTGPGGLGTGFLSGTAASDILVGTTSSEIVNGYGGSDTVRAGSGEDTVYGGTGSDLLAGNAGNDRVYGESGQDNLNGGAGGDDLWGGRDADVFSYTSLNASRPFTDRFDTIHDFSAAEGDRISLSAIDANTNADGDQHFSFIGTAGFTGAAGELRYTVQTNGVTVLADVNGDGTADFMIKLLGISKMTLADFVL